MNCEPTTAEIEKFVRNNLKISKIVQERSGAHYMGDCPICGKKNKFYLNQTNGLNDCKVCGESGNLWSLASRLGVRIRSENTRISGVSSVLVSAIRKKSTKPKNAPNRSLAATNAACAAIADINDPIGQVVKNYLKSRCFDAATIKHFRVGRTTIWTERGYEPAIQIPYIVDDKVVMTKERNITVDKNKREFRRSKGAMSPLFNAEAIKNRDQVVLVEGELDVMSLWQCGIANVASTSTGAKKEMPQEWMDALANVKDIVIWYDDDEAGEEAVESLQTYLGSYRCRIASIPDDLSTIGASLDGAVDNWRPNDANDLLRLGVGFDGFKKIIDDAVETENNEIVLPSSFAQRINDAIENSETHLGIPFDHGCVTKYLRGIRGELTLITGHTGHGKSTWALDHLMAFSAQTGENILLTSYENGAMALARKIFQRCFGRPISTVRTEQDKALAAEAIDSFEAIKNVWIVDHSGDSDLDKVCEHIIDAVHRHNIKAVLIDHLEFILPPPSAYQKSHDLINTTLKKLSKLASDLDVGIYLVAHPNGGVSEKQLPTGDDVKGSSGVKQLIDNGITVYRRRRAMGENLNREEITIAGPTGTIRIELGSTDAYVSVWKKRHDEVDEGDGVYIFDRSSLKYSDLITMKKEESTDCEPDVFEDEEEFQWM